MRSAPVTFDHVVLLAHGSPDPRHAESVSGIAGAVSRDSGVNVGVAYLRHHGPTLAEALRECGSGRTAVLPLLLAAGAHALHDVTRFLRGIDPPPSLIAPPTPEALAPAIAEAVGECHPRPRVVALAPAGSRVTNQTRRYSGLATRATVVLGIECSIAPDAEALEHLTDTDWIVVPLVVSEGFIADGIGSAARKSGARVTRPLGAMPAFARALAQAVTSARG